MSNFVEIDSTEHQVYSVCVFSQSNRAEIRRLFSVDLKAGQNEIKIQRLTDALDKESIRVEGLGGKNATIIDVVHTAPPIGDSKWRDGDDLLKTLDEKILSLDSEKSILEGQSVLLEAYAQSMDVKKADLLAFNSFFDLYAEQKRSIQNELSELGSQLADLRTKLQERRNQLYLSDTGVKRGTTVTVIINCEKDGKAELSMWYFVNGASWTPIYDFRVQVSNTKKEPSKASLQYRGSISQSTGEDWSDVALSLSTASPLSNSEIPTLEPYRIGPPIIVRETSKRMALSVGGGGRDRARERSGGSAMRRSEARVIEGALSTTYEIEGRSNIPHDPSGSGKNHKVAIAVVDLIAKLEWITIPQQKASAFLRCQVKNTSPYLFMEGQASVFMDDSFICKTTIPNVQPQESFSTSLGVDPAIRITYHPAQQRKKNAGSSILAVGHKTDITSFNQSISIKNTRTGPAGPIFVKDQVAVSVDSAFKVGVLEPRELGVPKDRKEVAVVQGVKARYSFKEEPGTGDGDSASVLRGLRTKNSEPTSGIEEEGVIEWVCDLEAGRSVDLALVWEVAAPAGQRWQRTL